MKNEKLYLAKFGVPVETLLGEEYKEGDGNGYTHGTPCKVCGLNYWAHIGDKCFAPTIMLIKFPFGYETKENAFETKWNVCEVCHQNGGSHYISGAVCPKDFITYSALAYNADIELQKIFSEPPKKMKSYNPCVVEPPAPKPTYAPRTQKARGIAALKRYRSNVPTFQVIPIEKVTAEELVGKFVRPCPMRPRHGFVDSRLINTLEEANRIIEETREADPEAEFLIMKKIDAEFSGIFTPGLLAIGPGNAGATSGVDAVTIPVMGTPFSTGYKAEDMLREASIESAPYLELLWKNGVENPYEVQLRDGPKLPQTVDFIPAKIEVKHVELAGGDLLEWESKIKSFPVGTVVFHPGGTLASHYAVHAALNNVPVVVSHEPKIGETLTPTESEVRKVDIKKLRAGYMLASKMELKQEEAAYLMITGCHHVTQWAGKHDFLLGAAMGAAWRLTVIAVLGEFRHWGQSTAEGQMRRRRRRSISREGVYGGYWKKADQPLARFRFRRALYSFAHDSWSSSFGGKSWFRFGQWALQMHNALVQGESERALETLNSLVHSAHNNGWGFNKFITDAELDRTAENPVYAALKCGSALYRTESLSKDKVMAFWLAKTFMRFRRPLKEIASDIDLAPTLKSGKKASACKDCPTCGECISHKECKCGVTKKVVPNPIPNESYPYSPILSAQIVSLPEGKFRIQYKTEADTGDSFRVLNGKFRYTNSSFNGECYLRGEILPSLENDGIQYVKMVKSYYHNDYGDGRNEVWSIGSDKGYYVIIPSGKN